MCWLSIGQAQAILAKCNATADILDNDGSVSLTQEFSNPLFGTAAATEEAVYNFPLQSTSAVYSFVTNFLDKDDKVLKTLVGKCKEKQEAREEYEEAKANNQTAQLLEVDSEKSPDIFVVSIGTIPKECAKVSVNIKYYVELASEEGNKVKRFTLPATVAARYGDTSKKPFGSENMTIAGSKFEFTANIVQSKSINLLESPSHSITTKLMVDGSPKKASISFASDEVTLSQNVVLKIGNVGDASSTLLIQNPESITNPEFKSNFGDTTIAKFNFTVGAAKDKAAAAKKNFIFVIDRSGSMSGANMREAKKALNLCLTSLPKSCMFNICSFGSSFSLLFSEGSRDYSEDTLKQARAHVESMSANLGGTEILKPLQTIFAQNNNLPTIMFLLTDGQVSNTQAVIKAVEKQHSEKKTKVFTCGIGGGVSQHLVDGIAKAAGGTSTFIAHGERMNAKLASQMKQARADPFTKLSLKIGDLAVSKAKLAWTPETVFPEFAFDGENVSFYLAVGVKSVVALSDSKKKIELHASGKDGELILGTIDPQSDVIFGDSNLTVPALREQVGLVENGKEKKSAKKRAVKLSVCANIVTKYTSLVAVDEKAKKKKKEMKVAKINSIKPKLAPPPPAPTGGYGSANAHFHSPASSFSRGASGSAMKSLYAPRALFGSSPSRFSDSSLGGATEGLAFSSSPARQISMSSLSFDEAPKKSAMFSFGGGRKKTKAKAPKKDKAKKKSTKFFARKKKAKMAFALDDSLDEIGSPPRGEQATSAMPPNMDMMYRRESPAFAPSLMMKETVYESASAPLMRSTIPTVKQYTKFETLDVLIKLQKPDGSFSNNGELLSALGISDLGKDKSDAFVTALVVTYARSKLTDLKDEWELMIEKADQWLDTNVKKKKNMFKAANKLIANSKTTNQSSNQTENFGVGSLEF